MPLPVAQSNSSSTVRYPRDDPRFTPGPFPSFSFAGRHLDGRLAVALADRGPMQGFAIGRHVAHDDGRNRGGTFYKPTVLTDRTVPLQNIESEFFLFSL